nr:retrotransposon protein, putative, Ty1-copia subclass [Tanacetum cinerariifolium]
MVRSMMNLTTLPKSFWGYALESVARTLNMVLTKKVDKTPYEIWNEKAPNLPYLKDTHRKQLDNTSTTHIEKNIFVARYAEFFENSLTLQEAGRINVYLELIQEDDTQPSENTSEQHNEVEHMDVEPHSEIVTICRYNRIPQVLDRYGFHVELEEHELGDLNEPPNYKAASSD